MSNRVFVIAEAGVNHNSDMSLAYEMIDASKEAGADAVKFQTAVPELVVSKYATMADYQKKNIGEVKTQLEMTKEIHLPIKAFSLIQQYCSRIGIQFMSTAFDLVSLDYLISLNMDIFKIPSGEITNLPYLETIGRLNKRVILSTGMSDMCEIERALNVLLKMGTRKDNVTILHANTEYPTPMKDVNLNAMVSIGKKFGVKFGYSDHTQGIEVDIAAVAMGASVIEKHFTLDKTMVGPDHKASLEPHELKDMVCSIRNIELAMGDGIKKPSDSEKKNIEIARKSIVAKKNICQGEFFSTENITIKRPGNGISPMDWYEILGQVSQKNYTEDELI